MVGAVAGLDMQVEIGRDLPRFRAATRGKLEGLLRNFLQVRTRLVHCLLACVRACLLACVRVCLLARCCSLLDHAAAMWHLCDLHALVLVVAGARPDGALRHQPAVLHHL